MGYLPEWYLFMRAAKYLGAKPWELERQPVIWTLRAIDAMGAEAFAERELERRAAAKRGKR